MSVYERFSEQDLAILQARAERAAKLTHESGSAQVEIALHVMLGSESYALPVDMLRAVYENVTVVLVPCTPAHVAGIANIRGRITPVLDLAALLSVPWSGDNAAVALVVVATADLSLALQVDRIGEIITFATSSINSLPSGGDTRERTPYLQGILESGAILLDIRALLTDPQLIVNDM